LLEARGFEVLLVNARHVKNVTGRKRDVLDCQRLQQLHSYGLPRGALRPAEAVRTLRVHARQRGALLRTQSRLRAAHAQGAGADEHPAGQRPFADHSPRGFRRMQRDRNFENHQDDGVFYDRRPSLWVEPRTGLGGVVGQKRKYFSWRFAVDFAGGDLALVDAKTEVEAVISASRGRVEITSARPLVSIRGWRAMFDMVPDASTEPIALRLFFRARGQALSETWRYEWMPPPVAQRALD